MGSASPPAIACLGFPTARAAPSGSPDAPPARAGGTDADGTFPAVAQQVGRKVQQVGPGPQPAPGGGPGMTDVLGSVPHRRPWRIARGVDDPPSDERTPPRGSPRSGSCPADREGHRPRWLAPRIRQERTRRPGRLRTDERVDFSATRASGRPAGDDRAKPGLESIVRRPGPSGPGRGRHLERTGSAARYAPHGSERADAPRCRVRPDCPMGCRARRRAPGTGRGGHGRGR